MSPRLEHPHDLFLERKRFESLDGIRALSCLAVIKAHTMTRRFHPRLFGQTAGFGVDMFFVISGFLIVTLLIRERERYGKVNLRKFYARRAIRIFPIYYILIFTVMALSWFGSRWAPGSWEFYRVAFPVLLTYTQTFFFVRVGLFYATWSLAMEEQFYLVWPTIERLSRQSARWLILTGMIVINLLLGLGAFDGFFEWIYNDPKLRLPHYYLGTTFCPILLGVALAYLLHDRRTFSLIYHVIGWRWSPYMVLAILFVTTELLPLQLRGWPRFVINVLFALLIGSLVVREDHYARRLLTLPIMLRLGVISYGMYLYHTWVIATERVAIRGLGLSRPPQLMMFVIAAAGTILVAELSYRFIERPLLNLKQRFAAGA
jgi:peptidoglycan/LPS O-acetylase OafA/YrhL